MKQVIIIRKDLKMRKGKMVAQGAHASMAVFFNRLGDEFTNLPHGHWENRLILNIDHKELEWIDGSFTKICVSVDSEHALVKVWEKAVLAELPCAIITDNGLTEFNGEKTLTAVAIGPADNDVIDEITGGLKLL